jgi:hypothetical protein
MLVRRILFFFFSMVQKVKLIVPMGGYLHKKVLLLKCSTYQRNLGNGIHSCLLFGDEYLRPISTFADRVVRYSQFTMLGN